MYTSTVSCTITAHVLVNFFKKVAMMDAVILHVFLFIHCYYFVPDNSNAIGAPSKYNEQEKNAINEELQIKKKKKKEDRHSLFCGSSFVIC